MDLEKDFFYVITFESPNQAIQVEKQIKSIFEISVIPTPRELDKSCGIAIKFNTVDLDKLFALWPTIKIPGRLFKLSNKKINGSRETQEIQI
jgi:hypothetical protein